MDAGFFYVSCSGQALHKIDRATLAITGNWLINWTARLNTRFDAANGFIYSAEATVINRMDVNTFVNTRISWTAKGNIRDFDISPDGSSLYFATTTGLYQVAIADLNTPINASVTGTGNTTFTNVIWIDDGSRGRITQRLRSSAYIPLRFLRLR
jgi:hypothetical protein